MKKISTAAAKQTNNLAEQKLTIGLDLGDRSSWYCVFGKLGTHAFRHTYRSWLDAVGTPIAVQQKLMRHSDIRTTMNIYGDIVTDEMSQAHSKVVGLALPKV
jgi:integrase